MHIKFLTLRFRVIFFWFDEVNHQKNLNYPKYETCLDDLFVYDRRIFIFGAHCWRREQDATSDEWLEVANA